MSRRNLVTDPRTGKIVRRAGVVPPVSPAEQKKEEPAVKPVTEPTPETQTPSVTPPKEDLKLLTEEAPTEEITPTEPTPETPPVEPTEIVKKEELAAAEMPAITPEAEPTPPKEDLKLLTEEAPAEMPATQEEKITKLEESLKAAGFSDEEIKSHIDKMSEPVSAMEEAETKQIEAISPTESQVAVADNQKNEKAESATQSIDNPYNISISQIDYELLSDPNANSSSILAEKMKMEANKAGISLSATQYADLTIKNLEAESKRIDENKTAYSNMISKTAQENRALIAGGQDFLERQYALERDKLLEDKANNIDDLRERRNKAEAFMRSQIAFGNITFTAAGMNRLSSQVTKYDGIIAQTTKSYDFKLRDLQLQQDMNMFDYTKQIIKINRGLDSDMSTATKNAEKAKRAIRESKEATQIEKEKLKNQVFLDYQKNMSNLAQTASANAQKEAETARKNDMDLQKSKFDSVGLVWTVNENGNVVAMTDTEGKPMLSWKRQKEQAELDLKSGKLSLDETKANNSKYFENQKLQLDQWYKKGLIDDKKYQRMLQQSKMAQDNSDSLFSNYGYTQEGYRQGMLTDYQSNALVGMFDNPAKVPSSIRNNCVFFCRKVSPTLPTGLYSLKDKINIVNAKTASVGSTAIIDTGDTTGHVATVEKINADGTITIAEANWKTDANGRKTINRRTGTPEQLKVRGYWQDPASVQEPIIDQEQQDRLSLATIDLSKQELESTERGLRRAIATGNRKQAEKIIRTTEIKRYLPLTKDIEKNYNTNVKPLIDIFRKVQGTESIYREFLKNPEVNKVALDEALVVGFLKAFDPTSVVREGEFARIVQGTGMWDSLKGWASKNYEGGSGLTNENREVLISAMRILKREAMEAKNNELDSALIKSRNVDVPEDFILRQLGIKPEWEVEAEREGKRKEDIIKMTSGAGELLKTGAKSLIERVVDRDVMNFVTDQTGSTKEEPELNEMGKYIAGL